MIDRHAVGQYTFDIPEPAVKQRMPPEGYVAIDNLPELTGDVVLDFENDDPGISAKMGSSWARPGEGQVCGFAIAWRGGPPFYCPIAHAGGNGDGEKYMRWLRAQCAKPEVTIIGANTIYDLGWALREGIDVATPPVDVQGLAALLEEDRNSYSLDSLMFAYLGRRKGTDGLFARAREYGISNPYLHMKRLPAWDVADYAIEDAVGTLELYDKLTPLIEAEGLGRVLELERECLLIARDLRWRGVRVEQDAVARTMADFGALRDAAVARIKDLTGVNVSPWDAPSIARALEIENPDHPFERTSKGIPSIRAGILEAMNTPVAAAVREARQYDKAINTALAGIAAHVGRDGRIHGEFHPLRKTDDTAGEGATNGTVSGRWSASSPNLQNVHRRITKIGTPIRKCFLPEEGEEWLKADYSSQEPRLSTHYAYVARAWVDGRGRWRLPTEPHHQRLPLPGAEDWVRRYLADPEMSFHKEVGKAMGVGTSGPMYDALKVNNLALIYGLSGKTFAVNNGYPTKWITGWNGNEIEVAGDEAQAIIDRHTAAVPWGKPLAALMKEAAELRGYVKTILGRRIRYHRRDASGRLYEARKALNNAVQGSAADQMKSAMVLFRRAGITPLVVVHDDGNFSKPMGEAGEKMMAQVAQIMADALPISVPSLAEMKVGATWGDV